MYLKSLVLHGFKSFPNRTVLTFERGATVIVGPNGSGKSNISDAMRWVLGELSSRNIRGTKMEDVIFGGTDDRRPMGFAEVSVTFDNTDPESRLDTELEEVTVTRRYYRTGESEYLINKENKRLKDIHMLFMNTGVGREGYSIIGQGKVAEIVSKKSDDRRSFFEEAAGISKYRYRKEESERKLKGVSENLERVNDIRLELEGRVGPLEKEAEKARRGLAIYEEKKRADVSLWLFDTKKIRDDIDEARAAYQLSQHELDIVREAISDLEAQTEALYLKSQSNKVKSAELGEKIREATEKLHALDNSLRVAESNFEHSAEMIDDALKRIEEIGASKSQVLITREEKAKLLKSVEAVLAEKMDSRLVLLTEQQKLTEQIDALRLEVDHAADDITIEENTAVDLKVRIDVLKNAIISDGFRSKEIEAEISRYEEEGKKLKDEADRCDKAAAGFRTQIEEKETVIKENSEAVTAKREQRERLTEEYNRLRVEYDGATQRADTLERMNEHFDGYMESVKFVMREYRAGNITGCGEIYGPLSSLINVEKRYITAIETALGASLQNIVVEDENTAKGAIAALKRANAGRATFYPVNAIKSPRELEEASTAKGCPGFVGRADTLVSADRKYSSVIEYLLLRTLVFDNIDNASYAAKKIGYRIKMVTLDGQIINAGGSFTGGSAKRDSGILSRVTEIAALKDKCATLSIEIEKTKKAVAELSAELDEAQAVLSDAEEARELLLTLSRGQFSALDHANANYAANRSIIEKLTQDYENIKNNNGRADEEIATLTANLGASDERKASLLEYRSKKALDMGVLDEKRDEVISRVNDVNISIAETRKEIESQTLLIESIDDRIRELDAEVDAQNSKIDSLTDKRRGIESLRLLHRAEYEELESLLDSLNRERRETDEAGDEFERERNSLLQKTREKTAGRETMMEYCLRNENKLNALLEKQDKLGSQLWDDYEISYEDAVALDYPPVTAENRDEVAAIQTSCRSRLRSLGNYNPGAIEEYAEVKTRYDYLNTQYTDLTKSREELIGIITRIEEEMRLSFIDAFNSINKHFGITFRELFGGGNAELSLTDPEDVLTSGIEIKAAPPGKIIKSMSLLSGGEQSFVAIALLFAILKVNPTPFCILDEIEAALDEVNVFRFGEYVKRLEEETQFILITHRRGTMEIGDRLYGVTMPERGISQAIELNVNEIEGKQKELLDGVL